MSNWDPQRYLRYERERTRPSHDLAGRIDLTNPRRIVDIGCGPGNSTKVLHDRWPDAEITGLDNSPEMIEKARATAAGIKWVLADASTWDTPDRFDIVFSNAALHWLPDHERTVKKLFGLVQDSGVLAVQVPANYESPFHQALVDVSEKPEWTARMRGCRTQMTYNSGLFYYDLLCTVSKRIEMWTTTYFHVLENHKGIIEWYSSTGLKPYLTRLETADEKERFGEEILERCKERYPVQKDGKIVFPFKRLFFIAVKG